MAERAEPGRPGSPGQRWQRSLPAAASLEAEVDVSAARVVAAALAVLNHA